MLTTPLFKSVLPTANTNLLSAGITLPANKTLTTISIYVKASVQGQIKLTRTKAGTTDTEILNGGSLVIPDVGTALSGIPLAAGETVNLQYTATGGTITLYVLDEGDMG